MKGTTPAYLNCRVLAAAAILGALLLFGVMLMAGLPWWLGISPSGMVLVIAGLLLVGRRSRRRKEEHFVPQSTAEEGGQQREQAAEERYRFEELQRGWQEAVQALRRSHLKKEGNPLYVLPWYLVMGAPGSGKSASLEGAALSSSFSGPRHSSGLSGTRHCDWWFFDQAILIDTAGRYSQPAQSRDRQEWRKFLSLLVKYRKREPISGVILTVAADKLMHCPPEVLEKDGRELRLRMDELMWALGVRFPVYALVTKCDLIQGMARLSERLPEKSRAQAMGVCNEELSPDVAGFVERGVASLAERLRHLRLLMLRQPGRGAASPGLLLFPDQVEALKPGLIAFLSAAFQENRYQESPLLRGVYLCSGRVEGLDPGGAGAREILPGTGRGLFLHDFFARLLPRDRGLLVPTARCLRWQGLTRNLALTSWLLLGTVFAGLLTCSFARNAAAIREASAVMGERSELNGDLRSDLAATERWRRMIVEVERKNRSSWMPRLGLNQSGKVEAALKARYCRQFRERFLVPLDGKMNSAIAGFASATPDRLSGSYIVHLSRRINLVQARLKGGSVDPLAARPLPSFLPELSEREAETTLNFGSQYKNYLVWSTDRGELGRELQMLRSLLKQLYLVKGAGLAWVVDQANRGVPGAGFTMRSFWGGSRSLAKEPSIAPAFTRKGKEYVVALLGELSAAYPDRGLEREKEGFERWYRACSLGSWERFALFFPKGEERLRGEEEWRGAARVMASGEGPYFLFLKRAVLELEPFDIGVDAPPWLTLARRYQLLKLTGRLPEVAAGEGKGVAASLGELVGQKGAVAAPAAGLLPAPVRAVQEYLGAMGQIAPLAGSRKLAYQMAFELFAEETGVGNSPFYRAAGAAQRLNRALAGSGGDETFSRLISGPVMFYGTFARRETACHLQKQWEEKVLKEVQGAADAATLQYLLGKEGPVWKFVADSAGPFIGWTPGRGYYPKAALGGEVPFQPGFYSFLAKGTKAKVAAAANVKPNYSVTIRGLPTDANSDSSLKPHSTRLELQCASGPQVIENLNYPVSRTFVWSPESCGDLLFQVGIGDVTLTKRYSGAQAFPDFLHDFRGGRRTISAGEFPGERRALERMGVRFIRVNYRITGESGILAAGAAKAQPKIPERITQCWD